MRVTVGLGLMAVLVGMSSGCLVDNESSVEVLGSPPWEVETGTDADGNTVITACKAPASGDSYLSTDTFDVTNSLSFTRPFVIQSNMVNDQDLSAERLNTKDFIIEKAVVSYDGVDSTSQQLLSSLQTEVPTGLNVSAGGDAGLILPIIPRNIGQVFSDSLVPNDGDITTVLVRTHLEGHTTDGHKLSSQTFTFPVNVCRGCANPCQTSDCLCDHFAH